MSESVKNLPISILSRLRNKAQAEGRNAQDMLRYYAIERFLYRLSQSDHSDRFVLKGALIFLTWGIDLPRPTRDIDLRGFTAIDVETICSMMREICLTPVVSDGMVFDANSVVGETISEAARYQGVRIRFNGALGKARTPMQIDIGFSDAITPSALRVRYPTLLDMPAPELQGYPPETVVAEKVEAMIVLDQINSRMKDFYDIWLIAQRFEFEGRLLQQAIQTTFHRRHTELPRGVPVALSDSFAMKKQDLWRTFVIRYGLGSVAPLDFGSVVEGLRAFLMPIINTESFSGHWSNSQIWLRPALLASETA
ncbi:MAG: nucleotidyl transferase AbiEii/AbiGii toxin family protein [Caldilineales bacterium]|nr:nucleotidyl transferase AbiEii/AbiGii toxin family protein [Caldilineales bacterium]